MNRAAARERVQSSPESKMAFEDWMNLSDDAIQLDSCRAFDWVVVQTIPAISDHGPASALASVISDRLA